MTTTPDVGPLCEAVPRASVQDADSPRTVDVPSGAWVEAARAARDLLGCTFLDFLSAVDEGEAVRVICHVVSPTPFAHLLLRTLLPAEAPRVGSLREVYAGASWHERETAEMFGVTFLGPTAQPLVLPRLLLADDIDAHPLRKDFLLEARLEQEWPGAKEPGESDLDPSPSRRRLRPPGVPEVHP